MFLQSILWIWVLFRQDVQGKFSLYHTDRTNINYRYFDCLYYEVPDINIQNLRTSNNLKNNYQIIPYCIRPLLESEIYHEINEGNVLSRFTFEELRAKQVTTQNLILWSAPIDLIEHYDEYIDSPLNTLSKLDIFYNCSSLWFGTFCQYTFDVDCSFNQIVNKTFTKTYWQKSNMGISMGIQP
ncbi:unnamed protein product [Rotaria sp. Silwood2]|nr:unnamed protein product [Rotaria sp. Silwood2]CAF3249802.1 unnamed protein product [Rotaria sp. Silwood2]CAF4588758.1 unnamed protein product [Rotaria sp. Silwood2]CAF4655944.1 unnamed protein product [Rotaria sp. Silwood2]